MQDVFFHADGRNRFWEEEQLIIRTRSPCAESQAKPRPHHWPWVGDRRQLCVITDQGGAVEFGGWSNSKNIGQRKQKDGLHETEREEDERMKEHWRRAEEPGWTAAYTVFIQPLEHFLVISQVEMISYITQWNPPFHLSSSSPLQPSFYLTKGLMSTGSNKKKIKHWGRKVCVCVREFVVQELLMLWGPQTVNTFMWTKSKSP